MRGDQGEERVGDGLGFARAAPRRGRGLPGGALGGGVAVGAGAVGTGGRGHAAPWADADRGSCWAVRSGIAWPSADGTTKATIR
ncbi:hypothetical protein ACWC9T_37450 [Kitasatospora sp. NPDC001159]